MNHVFALEEDVAEDVEANGLVGLNTAKACAAATGNGGVVNELSGHSLGNATDGDGEVGQSSRAREYVAALCGVDLGAGDLGVVCLCDSRVDVNQSGTCVDDTGDTRLDSCCRADRVSGCAESPETLAGVDIDVGNGAGVLSRVDEAEVVGTSGMVLKVNSEELLGKRRLDGVKECLLRGG